MPFHHHTLTFTTKNPIEIIDITASVKKFVEEVGVQEGLLTVASPHTTVGVVINERCEKLEQDMINFLGRLAPAQAAYQHNQVASDGRPNAHSHLLSLLLPSQLTIVISGGKLNLGKWQSVFMIELDGPRPERKVNLSLMG
jgi:secondary thiamine-phosphate synthase enzyme